MEWRSVIGIDVSFSRFQSMFKPLCMASNRDFVSGVRLSEKK